MIAVERAGRPTVHVDVTQPIEVDFVNDRAKLGFKYPFELRLTAIVRSDDAQLVLPTVRAVRVVVRDSYGIAVPKATVEAEGASGQFTWATRGTRSVPQARRQS